jgi:hypothetical protein
METTFEWDFILSCFIIFETEGSIAYSPTCKIRLESLAPGLVH